MYCCKNVSLFNYFIYIYICTTGLSDVFIREIFRNTLFLFFSFFTRYFIIIFFLIAFSEIFGLLYGTRLLVFFFDSLMCTFFFQSINRIIVVVSVLDTTKRRVDNYVLFFFFS